MIVLYFSNEFLEYSNKHLENELEIFFSYVIVSLKFYNIPRFNSYTCTRISVAPIVRQKKLHRRKLQLAVPNNLFFTTRYRNNVISRKISNIFIENSDYLISFAKLVKVGIRFFHGAAAYCALGIRFLDFSRKE